MATIRDMIPTFELFQPASVEDAVALMGQHGEDGWVLAGGLDSFDWFKDRIKRPEAVIDLALNWSQAGDEALRIVRLRSDGFDPRTLIPDEDNLEDAYRAFLDKLLTLTRALPLPDEESARGRPMRVYSDLDTYQREVLEVEG